MSSIASTVILETFFSVRESITPGIKDSLVVVAIDIGSAFSGYAYQYRTDYLKEPTKNIFCPLWTRGDNNSMVSGKTASTLLLNPDETFNSFG